MPKTKKLKLKMYESCAHFTYRGDIKINPDLFPQLKGKNEQEIANWVTEYADELYVNNKDESNITDEAKVTDEEPESELQTELKKDRLKSKKALETLLALAKTYISMDDLESARHSLEEVLEHGTKKQKEEAADLLESIKDK